MLVRLACVPVTFRELVLNPYEILPRSSGLTAPRATLGVCEKKRFNSDGVASTLMSLSQQDIMPPWPCSASFSFRY